MSQLGWSKALSIIPLLAGLTFVMVVRNEDVCVHDSIMLFERVKIETNDTVVNIYKIGDGDEHVPIAYFTSKIHEIKQANIVMDKEKNLWIIDVNNIDQGSYLLLKYDNPNEKPNNSTKNLTVMVAPASTCKPEITRNGNNLTAALLGPSCGNPMASIYWKNSSGHIIEGTHVLKLQAGKEVGTYYACTTGPSLRCARSSDPSSDYCSFIPREEEGTVGAKTQKDSDFRKDDLHIWLISIVSLLCAVFVLVLLFGIKPWRIQNIQCCTKNPTHDSSRTDTDGHEENPTHDSSRTDTDRHAENPTHDSSRTDTDGHEENPTHDSSRTDTDGHEENPTHYSSRTDTDRHEVESLLQP